MKTNVQATLLVAVLVGEDKHALHLCFGGGTCAQEIDSVKARFY
jgi:hypothetical protein